MSSIAWRPWFGMMVLILGLIGICFFWERLSWVQAGLAVVVWLGLLATVIRVEQFKLFGPVFLYEIIRLGRQSRLWWVRTIYACLLGFLLTWLHMLWGVEPSEITGLYPIDKVAEFASTFFYTFMIVQFLFTGTITPAYVAGAIAEEKERKTLEFLLATDLRSQEILFGKLAARVGNLGMFLLAGLPVLGLVQLFGGVDPNLVLIGFLATFITLLSISAVSILASVVSKRARDGIILAYLMMFSYLIASGLTLIFADNDWVRETGFLLGYEVCVADFGYAFISGNLIITIGELFGRPGAGTLEVELIRLFRNYATFHGLVIFICLAFAMWRLRAIALVQAYGHVGIARSGFRGRKSRTHPDVGEDPMVWKEVFVESGLRMSLLGRILVWLIFIISFVPVPIIFWNHFIEEDWRQYGMSRLSNYWWSHDAWEAFAEEMNVWVRLAGTIVSCLLLISVGVRGAGSVLGERDRQTLDSLLTTPLSATRMLWGKWWGCMLGLRKGCLWLISIWTIGLATGGLHIGAIPFLILAMTIFMGAFAWIGIFYSLSCTTSLRATIWTIMTCVFAGGGYFIGFGLFCILPLEVLYDASIGRDFPALMNVTCGVSPAVVIAFLPFCDLREVEFEFIESDINFSYFALFGCMIWIGIGYLLSRWSLWKFRQQTNRLPYQADSFVQPKINEQK